MGRERAGRAIVVLTMTIRVVNVSGSILSRRR